MSHTLTRAGLRLGAVLTTVGLIAGGLLLSSQGAATGAAPVPSLDHFLCYQARVAAPPVPPNIQLQNQIQTTPFAPTFSSATVHCNPANKTVPRAKFPARNPLAHLLCWKINYKFQPVLVEVANQFGKGVFHTGSPSKLCLPSWKDRTASPGSVQGAFPKGLDHLTCYPLTPVSYGFRPPAPVKAEDEFSAPKYVTLKLGRANELCVPTIKIVGGVAYQPQGPNDLSLVCFPTSATPYWKQVFDSNQFGNQVVYPNNKLEKFCLPSTLSVQGPAG